MTQTSKSTPKRGDKEPPTLSAQQSTEASAVSERVNPLSELVPEIGTGRRWYDVPYRVFSWLLNAWPRPILQPTIRRSLVAGINFLLVFNHHERNKAESLDDPSDNLILPDGARLRQGGIWTVELFPPSKYKNLASALRHNGWDQSPFSGFDSSNVESVRRARDGRGSAWFKIVSVAGKDTTHLQFDERREELPREFAAIELTAVQLGTGVTAVVAFFQLSEYGESTLNNVWCKKHEPLFRWRGLRRPLTTNRYFAAIETTQKERLRIHTLTRRWLSQRCPGFFASRSDSHPVMDLNLFDGVDIASQKRTSSSEALRALGMCRFGRDQYVSPELPGATLIPTYGSSGPHEPLHNCWAIAGEYQRIMNENERPGYGDKPYSPMTIGYMFNDAARSFVLYLAVMGFLDEQRAVHSAARDLATIRHRKFTIRAIRNLSEELLESGLDLPAMARDSKKLWGERWQRWQGLKVQSIPRDANPEKEEIDLIKFFGEHCTDQFKQMLEEDKNYRTVLSTAAALGSTTESAQIGRKALLVAWCSMVVASLTLLVTQPSNASLLSTLMDWLRQAVLNQ